MELLALTGRALSAVDTPDKHAIGDFKTWVIRNHAVIIPNFPTAVKSLTDVEFIESGQLPKATKLANYKAAQRLEETQPTVNLARKFATFHSFPKHEKVDKMGLNGIEGNAKPRVIQACSPEATVSTGRWLKSFQRAIHKRLVGSILFAAGINGEQLSAWFDRESPSRSIFLEDDFTLYDTTFSRQFHEIVLWLYQRAGMKTDPWAWAIRNAQVSSKGVSRYGFHYHIDGTMRSGVADTCVANSLLNMFSHLYVLHTLDAKETIHSLLSKVSMALMGDDNIMMLDSSLVVTGMAESLRLLGLKAKLVRRDTARELIFLNVRPYPVAQGRTRFAPLIGRLVTRLGYAAETQLKWGPYSKGVFQAFVESTAHVPMLSGFIQRQCDLRPGRLSSVYREKLRRVHEYDLHYDTSFAPTQQTCDFVSQIYGLTPKQIGELDTLLRYFLSVSLFRYFGSI